MSPSPATQSQDMRTLRKILIPDTSQIDVIPLYVEWGEATSHMSEEERKKSKKKRPWVIPDRQESHPEDFIDHQSTKVRAGSHMSFGTYFNAFPASYWRRWTTVKSVRLHAKLDGNGALVVYRSNARGNLQHVQTRVIQGATTVDIELPLDTFGDGGWYWFDLLGGTKNLFLRSAEWQAANNEQPPGSVTLQITTMNKPDYCVRNLRLLAANPEALEHIQEILLVDQGNQKVQDQPDFEEVAATLTGKLRIINQANLGGSGGFSRGMYEAVANNSDYVLLLDDDVLLEPASIPRLVVFADYCKTPTIVGGHMFDLHNRTALHTFGEVVNAWSFQPDQPLKEQDLGHDLRLETLRSTRWLHRRVDVDYNGWWMDLIPTRVIREIGLSLPVFIKWDDAEYGLRAKAAGFHTVSMPGAAVWHVSWVDKDDLVGWQAYFHIRNRIIAALLHSPYELGGKLLRESNYSDVKHTISMQYYTEDTRLMAFEDVLRGPDLLHEIQPLRIQEIRAMAKDYPDVQWKPDVEAFPPPHAHKPPKRGKQPTQPPAVLLPLWATKTLLKSFLVPVKQSAMEHPQAHIAHQDNKWWRMSMYDSALVTNAEGTGISWYKRDRAKFLRILPRSTMLHLQMVREWKRMQQIYRDALGRITSLDAWAETFEKHTESEIRR